VLTKKEILEFSKFLDRKRNSKEQKLKSYLNKSPSKGPKPAAELAIRKRLKKELLTFLSLNQMESPNDKSFRHHVYAVKELFDRKALSSAWKIALQLEKKLVSENELQHLRELYEIMLDNSPSSAGPDVPDLIERYQATEETLQKRVKQKIELARIKNMNRQHRSEGGANYTPLSALQDKLKNSLNNNDIVHSAVLMKTARRLAISHQKLDEYSSTFEEVYLHYRDFTPLNTEERRSKQDIYYAQFHVLYRLLKLKKLNNELHRMHKSAVIFKLDSEAYYSLSLIEIIAAFYSGKLELSKKMCIDMLSRSFIPAKYSLNLHLNYVVILACLKEYKLAAQIFATFRHSDEWCRKKMGWEWVLRKNLIYIMIQYDMGNLDIAEYQLSKFKSRKMKEVIDTSPEIMLFLDLLHGYFRSPESLDTSKLEELENKYFSDPQTIEVKKLSYYAWLKSKITKSEYYTEMLKLMEKYGA
jgi:hypothetical protein